MDARKTKFRSEDLAAVFEGVDRIVATLRGRRSEFSLRSRSLDREALEKAVLGPSGNLRAPAARVGRTLLVGFDPEVWSETLL